MRDLYTVWDESGFEVEIGAISAQEAADEYIDGGDYGTIETGEWSARHHVWARDQEGGVMFRPVIVDPPEPPCTHERGHRWSEGEPRGHGGGVILRRVCSRCGITWTTDTWHPDRQSGEPFEAQRYDGGAS